MENALKQPMAAGGLESAPETARASMELPKNISAMLPRNRKLLLGIVAGLMVLGFTTLLMWSGQPDYRPLYANLNETDAAQVLEFLQKEHVPYRLDGPGTIMVPADRVYATRIKLAGQEITPNNGMGFELFDKKDSFGLSDFTRKVNYQRALQGELARTIQVLPGVAAARVHLVMAKESAFVQKERKASASVMLQLVGGKRLPRETIIAVQNLVAASVPNLSMEAVTVVDSAGNLLSKEQNGEQIGMNAGQSLSEYQNQMERRMEGRLTSMLEQIVGPGQAVVRVTTDIDRQQLEQQREIYNPDEQVIRSQQTTEESRQSGADLAMGVPGVSSNNPANATKDKNGQNDSASRVEKTTNYEISKVTEHSVTPFGTVKKVSVAVIVGGSYKEVDGNQVFQPRSQAQLDSLKSLVEHAVGYSEDRGDVVDVQSMPLVDIGSGSDLQAMEKAESQAFILDLVRYGIAALAVILIGWFLLRPMAQRLISQRHQEPAPNPYLQHALTAETTSEVPAIEQAKYLAVTDPEGAARVLRDWVKE